MTTLPHIALLPSVQADHVGFSTTDGRRATVSRLRVSIGLVVFLGVAIGVCGAAIPPQAGWVAEAPAHEALARPVGVNDWLQAPSVRGS